MYIKLIFGTVAGLLAIICFVPYLRDIFKKKTTPNPYSWLIWALLQTIGTVAIIVGGGGWYATLGISAGALFCLLIFFLSLKFGTKDISVFDALCLIAAVLIIPVWIFTKNPLYSVILISAIDFIGYVPTIRKSYDKPWSETLIMYTVAAIYNILAILALSTYSLTTTLYFASLVFSNSLLVTILLYRRRKLSRKN